MCRDSESFDQVEIRVICRQLGLSIIGKYSCTLFSGSLQSLDWTSGLDWWAGLMDSLKSSINSLPGMKSNRVRARVKDMAKLGMINQSETI